MAAPLLLGEIRNFSKTYETLRELGQPASADQPISDPDVLYDTQTYAQAGSTTLTFFKSTAANLSDKTLSNFPTGILPKGQFFEIHRVFVFIHAMPTANATVAVTGAAQDVEILHKTARGVVQWKTNTRDYGPYPLWFFGRAGGPSGQFESYGSGTAANNVISSGNTENNGGFPVLGSQIIQEQQQFEATMTFVATSAISAATNITFAMLGIRHSQVR